MAVFLIYITGMQGAYGNANSEVITPEKYNPNGVSQWGNTYSLSGRASWGVGVAVNSTGDVYVTGNTTDVYNVNLYPDVQNQTLEALLKYDTKGKQQWGQVTPNPFQSDLFQEIVRAITLDASGNVYTTGVYNDMTPTVHKSYFDTIKRAP